MQQPEQRAREQREAGAAARSVGGVCTYEDVYTYSSTITEA